MRAALALAAAMLCAPAGAAAQGGDSIAYRIRPGDTLYALAERYLEHVADYRAVQRGNRIADPLRLPVGRTIAIPRALLRYRLVGATFAAVRGAVTIDGRPAAPGMAVAERALLVTGADSFATVVIDGGSRLSFPSSSRIRVNRLRRNVLGDSIDHDFTVETGEARGNVRKLESVDDRWQVRTVRSVSAVRGTDFQVRATDAGAYSEVVEGTVAVQPVGAAATIVPAGNGALIDPAGAARAEALLPEPELLRPGRVQADPELHFALKPGTATRFRVQLGADAGFVDRIADRRVDGDSVTLPALPDGNYFVKAAAISPAGFEGVPAVFAFKRRLNSVSASAGAAADGYAFRWTGEGTGVRRYRFQLFRGNTKGVAVVDEPALSGDGVTLSDLPPGTWFWRVGASQFADGEVETNWSDFEKLTVADGD